jgi:GT2 family glycosyltransferase
MAVRVAAMEAIGGFDPRLGVGGDFASAEDFDIGTRALLGGWHIYETDRTHVLHDGYRTNADCRDLMRRCWIGIGASYAKLLRVHQFAILRVAGRELLQHAILPPLRYLARGQRPKGLGALPAFARGLTLGLHAPLDRTTLRFVVDEDREASLIGGLFGAEVVRNARSVA